MSLENIRSDLAKKLEVTVTEVEPYCIGCPNLETTDTRIGLTVLSCALERAAPQGGARAWWVAKALLDDNLNPNSGSSRFRDVMDHAAEGCPITARITSQLTQARGEELIDLSPPPPLVPGEKLKALDF